MKYLAIAVLGAIFALASPAAVQTAAAHPHVWATVDTEIEFGPNKEIVGFKHKWTFDEFYSQFAIEGLDTNGDGVYSEQELQPLAQTNVEALKEFDYFTFATVAGKKTALKAPTEYHLELKDKLLTLYFTLPLEKPVPASQVKDFSFSVYDPGFYIALTFDEKNPVKLASPTPLKCQAKVGNGRGTTEVPLSKSQSFGENIDPSSNFGAQFAQKVTLDCKG